MAPRALTEQEKNLQKKKIADEALRLLHQYGIKRISVDDVIQAAGVGKATFYRFFPSKEALLMELTWNVYSDILTEAEQAIQSSPPEELRSRVGAFIQTYMRDQEKQFFFKNHRELEALVDALGTVKSRDFSQMEYEAFRHLIQLAGLDMETVKPGVVHNYLHSIYFAVNDSAMMPDDLDETIAAMIEGLLSYMFDPKVTDS